jgi:hypothetical protein
MKKVSTKDTKYTNIPPVVKKEKKTLQGMGGLQSNPRVRHKALDSTFGRQAFGSFPSREKNAFEIEKLTIEN